MSKVPFPPTPEDLQMTPSSRIFVAGHGGLIGSAIVRRLEKSGYHNLILETRDDLDLRDQAAVSRFFARHLPEFVFVSAARTGSIQASATHPADFLYDNLAIQTNLIHSAWQYNARKLLFLAGACIYPRLAAQPIQEESLLTGPLEPTSEADAIAKIAGLKMAAAYRAQYNFQAITLVPTNIYGPGDNFDLETAQVLPALIRRFHEAKIWRSPSVTLWGTGAPRREFLHVDDLAAAACFAMERYNGAEHLNVGTGKDLTVAELAQIVADIVGYSGEIRFDLSRPDGVPRKLLEVSHIHALGWRDRIPLEKGIASTYEWYCANTPTAVAG
jgi:GDP-L-fucose synthase